MLECVYKWNHCYIVFWVLLGDMFCWQSDIIGKDYKMFTQIILPAARPVDDKIICFMRHLGKDIRTILILNTSLLRLNTEIIFQWINGFSYTTLVVGGWPIWPRLQFMCHRIIDWAPIKWQVTPIMFRSMHK